jgi:hypothetical protein
MREGAAAAKRGVAFQQHASMCSGASARCSEARGKLRWCTAAAPWVMMLLVAAGVAALLLVAANVSFCSLVKKGGGEANGRSRPLGKRLFEPRAVSSAFSASGFPSCNVVIPKPRCGGHRSRLRVQDKRAAESDCGRESLRSVDLSVCDAQRSDGGATLLKMTEGGEGPGHTKSVGRFQSSRNNLTTQYPAKTHTRRPLAKPQEQKGTRQRHSAGIIHQVVTTSPPRATPLRGMPWIRRVVTQRGRCIYRSTSPMQHS